MVDNTREQHNDRHLVIGELFDLGKFEYNYKKIPEKERGLGHVTLKILGIVTLKNVFKTIKARDLKFRTRPHLDKSARKGK